MKFFGRVAERSTQTDGADRGRLALLGLGAIGATLALSEKSADAASNRADVQTIFTTRDLLTMFPRGAGAPPVVQTLGRTKIFDGGGASFRYDASDTASLDNGGSIRIDGAGRRWRAAIPPEGYVFELFGAAGDGTSDDSAAINNATASAMASGLTQINGMPGKTYRINSSVLPRQNLIWNFHGATLVSAAAIRMISNSSDMTKKLIGHIVEDITGPTSQLRLTSVAGLSVGSWAAIRLGNNPFDHHEPRYAVTAKVIDIDKENNVVTFDWVIPYSIHIAISYTYNHRGGSIEVPPATDNNKAVYLLQDDFPLNVTFKDGQLAGDTGRGVEGGFCFQWGANIKFENIGGNLSGTGDMGAGLFGLIQFCRNVRIDNPVLNSNNNTRGQGSLGRMFNFSNCIDVIVMNLACMNVHNCVSFVESFCEGIKFVNPTLVCRRASMLTKNFVAFFCGQGSKQVIENPSVTTDNGFQTFDDDGGSDGTTVITGNFVWRGPMAHRCAELIHFDGVFDYANPADGYAVVDFSCKQMAAILVNDNGPNLHALHRTLGPIVDAYYFASSRALIGGHVTGFYAGYGSHNSSNALSSLAAGRAVYVGSNAIGMDYGGFTALISQGQILVTTDSLGLPAGAFIGALCRCGQVIQSGTNAAEQPASFSVSDPAMKIMLTGQAF